MSMLPCKTLTVTSERAQCLPWRVNFTLQIVWICFRTWCLERGMSGGQAAGSVEESVNRRAGPIPPFGLISVSDELFSIDSKNTSIFA